MEHAQNVAGVPPLPSLKRRLLSGSAWAFGGKMTTILAQLVSNALLARLLSPQDLGAYFLAFSIVSVGSVVGSLGLHQTIVRFVAESMGLDQPGRTRRAVILVLKIGTLGALGAGVVYLLCGGVLGERLFHSPALAAVTGLVAGWVIVMALQLLLSEVFRGFNDIRSAAIFGGPATYVVLAACLSLLWLLKGQASLPIIILLAIASGFTSALIASWLLTRRLAHLPSGDVQSGIGFGEVLYVAGPLLVSSLALLALNQADLWIMGAFRSQEEVAVYGAAARLVLLVSVPVFVINALVSPLIAEMYAQGRKEQLERVLRTIVALSTIPAFVMLVSLALFGSSVLGIIYGDYYRQGAAVLTLLGVGYFANVWTGPCGTTLVMTGRHMTVMITTILSSLLAIAGALWLIQDYGGIGVASAMAATMTFQNILLLVLTKKQAGLWTHAGFSASSIRKVFFGRL